MAHRIAGDDAAFGQHGLGRAQAALPVLEIDQGKNPRIGRRGLLASAGGDAVAGPFDGEEGITLMADLDAGATGTMPSALLPDLIEPVLVHHREGRREAAAAAYARILPLVNFENRQCGLRAAKTVMAEGGVIESAAVRHPLEPLDPATRAGLLELAREADPIALSWGK